MMAFRDGEKNGELMTGGLVKYEAPLTYLLTVIKPGLNARI